MIKRDMYLKRLEMYVDREEVKIITGVRRSGKTTLMLQLIDEMKEAGVPDENIVYLNFEGLVYSYFNDPKELCTMLASYAENASGHMYIFLDEIQRIRNWADAIVDTMKRFDCEFFVSASNMSIFYDGFAKTLDYKYIRIDVLPLTFAEFLAITEDEYAAPEEDAGEDEEKTDTAPKKTSMFSTMKEKIGSVSEENAKTKAPKTSSLSRKELFLEYLRRGAMPGVYSLAEGVSAEDYLKNVYNTIMLKDVVSCNKLRDVEHLDKIMEFVMSHIGETFSPKSLKDYVKSQGVVMSVDTVYSFLNALRDAFIVYRVPRYDIKEDRELETHEKYYICDLAMRNAAMGTDDVNIDQAIESAVFNELLSRGFKVMVGKLGNASIDFCGVKGEDRTYLNCCETVSEKESVKKNFGPLTRIKDNYFKMVLSLDDSTMINKGGIINYPVTEFLSQG